MFHPTLVLSCLSWFLWHRLRLSQMSSTWILDQPVKPRSCASHKRIISGSIQQKPFGMTTLQAEIGIAKHFFNEKVEGLQRVEFRVLLISIRHSYSQSLHFLHQEAPVVRKANKNNVKLDLWRGSSACLITLILLQRTPYELPVWNCNKKWPTPLPKKKWSQCPKLKVRKCKAKNQFFMEIQGTMLLKLIIT